MGTGLFEEIRAGTRAVVQRARSVRIDDERLVLLTRELDHWEDEPSAADPAQHAHKSAEETLAYVIILDSVNFGSGWFPHLKKRPGCSGYFTLARSLEDHFETHGPWTADDLISIRASDCASVFGQDPIEAAASEGGAQAPVAELMTLFADALRDLGALLREEYGGRFERLVEAAGGSAERLAGLLARMPYYRDVSRYEELSVPFYKRAQLTASDLATAFGGQGLGRFDDLHTLTMFADNLVPHVLRRQGVLLYSDELSARIDREELLMAGSREEVEIRAAAVCAVERMAEASARSAAGPPATASQLDSLLWRRGQRPDMKAHPRHRTRCVYY